MSADPHSLHGPPELEPASHDIIRVRKIAKWSTTPRGHRGLDGGEVGARQGHLHDAGQGRARGRGTAGHSTTALLYTPGAHRLQPPVRRSSRPPSQ